MAWPKTFTIPDASEICQRAVQHPINDQCRCAIGWMNYNFNGSAYEGPCADTTKVYEQSTEYRAFARKLRTTMRRVAPSEIPTILTSIHTLNDYFLTKQQIAQCIAETAAHFGYTEDV